MLDQFRRVLPSATACIMLYLGVTLSAFAQGTWLDEINPMEEHPDGLHLYGLSIFGGYSSTPFLGGQATGLGYAGEGLGAEEYVGAAASLGWYHRGPNGQFSVSYSASYDRRLHYVDLSGLSQFLSFQGVRRISRRWDYSMGGAVSDLDYAQFLFTPNLFSQFASTPGTFQDLSEALLEGKYTSSQLASLLTGAPVLDTPARSLLFGNRVFNASITNSLTYHATGRLSISASAGVNRVQHLPDDSSAQLHQDYLIAQSTGGTAALGATYALSPRTFLEGNMATGRSFTSLEDAYSSRATVGLGHIMGQHWYLNVNGGAGFITRVRSTYALPNGPQAVGAASLGYRANAHTFMASYAHTLADPYGLGAGSTAVAMGAWNWYLPGRSWSLMNSVAQEELQASYGRASAVMYSAGLGHSMSHNLSLRIQYSFVYSDGHWPGYVGDLTSLSRNNARISLSWTPGINGLQMPSFGVRGM